MPQEALRRMRELLQLQAGSAVTDSSHNEVGRRYLDSLHTVSLVLLRHADDAWEARVTSLVLRPSPEQIRQCAEDVRAAAAELGLSVEPKGGTGAGPTQGVTAKVSAPPPGAGPVSLEQAEAIAVEWVNAGRPADGQVDAGVYEFELGYIVYPVDPPQTEVGTARGIIKKSTGELSVWPSLSLEMVAELYREKARSAASGVPSDD
jgi:hypothetical protein